MFNIGGPEVLVIILVALIVLGPTRLPDAARQVGKAMQEFRRMSSGFQRELRDALNEPVDTTSSARPSGTPTAATPATPAPPPAPSTNDDEPTA